MYATIADFQARLAQNLESANATFSEPLPPLLVEKFSSFLPLITKHGPPPLAQAAQEFSQQGKRAHAELLAAFWQDGDGSVEPGAFDFLARAFLQPYAALARSRETQLPGTPRRGPTPCLCPFCGRKPGLGVMRQMGDGGLRSLICSFCLGEWEFRRILCAACGEENHTKLPVYTAEEFPHVRVECCEACRCYIKTVDLTKNGLAEPVVDEIAAIPLDLWAQKQGYAKLQRNLMQM